MEPRPPAHTGEADLDEGHAGPSCRDCAVHEVVFPEVSERRTDWRFVPDSYSNLVEDIR